MDRDSDEGLVLLAAFKPAGNPTVVFADSTGKEIDRTVGYYEGPEKYKQRLEAILAGKNTLAIVEEEYRRNPDNIQAGFELAKKYTNMKKRDEARDIYLHIINNCAEKAKQTFVPYAQDHQINAYELAKFNLGINIWFTNDPLPFLQYIEEFPNGELTKRAYGWLGGFFTMSSYRNKEQAEKFWNAALAAYPQDVGLLTSYIEYCRKYKCDIEKALDIATDVIRERSVIFNEPYINRARIQAMSADSLTLLKTYGEAHLGRRFKKFAKELNFYADFWASRGENLESALKAALQALALDPGNHRYSATTALIYWKQGHIPEAIEYQSKALSANPDNETYRQKLQQMKKAL